MKKEQRQQMISVTIDDKESRMHFIKRLVNLLQTLDRLLNCGILSSVHDLKMRLCETKCTLQG